MKKRFPSLVVTLLIIASSASADVVDTVLSVARNLENNTVNYGNAASIISRTSRIEGTVNGISGVAAKLEPQLDTTNADSLVRRVAKIATDTNNIDTVFDGMETGLVTYLDGLEADIDANFDLMDSFVGFMDCSADQDAEGASECFQEKLITRLRERAAAEASQFQTVISEALAAAPYDVLPIIPAPTELTCPLDALDIAYGETVEIPVIDGTTWTLGERGSQLAVNNCRLVVQWLPEAIAEVLPDDWMSDSAKVNFFAFVVAPIRRLCDCLEADAALADDAAADALREVIAANLPAEGGERASQESLDDSRKAIVDNDNENRETLLQHADANRDLVLANADGNRDAIVASGDSNTKAVIDNSNSNKRDLITTGDANTQAVIDNANANRDQIIDNDNGNTDLVLELTQMLADDALRREIQNNLGADRCEPWMYTPLYLDPEKTTWLGGQLEVVLEVIRTVIDHGRLLGTVDSKALDRAQDDLDEIRSLAPSEAQETCRLLLQAYKQATVRPH